MSQQLVGVTPSPLLPVPEQPSALNQEPIPTTSKAESTIDSQTNTVTLQGSTQSPEMRPAMATNESTKPSLTSTLTPGVSPPPPQSSPPPPDDTSLAPDNTSLAPDNTSLAPENTSVAPDNTSRPHDDTPLPFVGFLGFLQPFRDFLHNPKRDWRPILVWFGLVALVAVSMGVSVGSDSRGIEPLGKSPCNKTGVGIIGQTLRFDSQMLTVRWSIIGCGRNALGGTRSPNNYAFPNIAVDVYLNNASDPAFSYDPGSLPGNVQLPSGRQGGLPPLALVSFENQYSVITGEQYRTPLERYDFTAFVFVIDPATNFSVPVVSFEVGDTGVGDFITTSETGASRSNFTYEPPTRNTSVVVTIPSSTTYATVRRTARAQALTFLMFTINWLLTLCTLVITGIVANKRVVKDGVALLPVSIILSVPAIRSLYIGSPPFGIFFDVVGFFPQMIIVVACAMVVLFISVLDKPDTGISDIDYNDPENNDPARVDPAKVDTGKSYTGEKLEASPGVL